jgi:hypothetical protein
LIALQRNGAVTLLQSRNVTGFELAAMLHSAIAKNNNQPSFFVFFIFLDLYLSVIALIEQKYTAK